MAALFLGIIGERNRRHGRNPEKPEKPHAYLKGLYELIVPEDVAKFAEKFQSLIPFLHTIREPVNLRVAIRGEANNQGEGAPRRFLAILCRGEPSPLTKGDGRLELAKMIASRFSRASRARPRFFLGWISCAKIPVAVRSGNNEM